MLISLLLIFRALGDQEPKFGFVNITEVPVEFEQEATQFWL